MNTYNSIDVADMDNSEILSICTELQTAKNWKAKEVKVSLSSGEVATVSVDKLPEYQQAFQTITGGR